ncbi:MAG: sulfurtransferase-like selenium metabolism protein YedF [Proteobacteria bacterium]|nr:sulfurtransferase-like selenium metabolism protein YedF [Pseudomonadota bacterium]MBU1688788.1 sulfurtransferase-like selenium metabolism protein YedF [Pseudomonadota bacterium]
MTTELNCRGLACPAPVIQVRNILEKEKPSTITVLVDTEGARESVSLYLTNQDFQVTVENLAGYFRLTGTGRGDDEVRAEAEQPTCRTNTKKTLIMVTTDRMGHGDDTLGAGLLLNFLKTLKEMGPELWRLVFVNNGVKLAVEGAEAVPVLKDLTESGVSILVCSTCLNHFKLLEKKQVGETTNMLDIVTSMQVADSVINI